MRQTNKTAIEVMGQPDRYFHAGKFHGERRMKMRRDIAEGCDVPPECAAAYLRGYLQGRYPVSLSAYLVSIEPGQRRTVGV